MTNLKKRMRHTSVCSVQHRLVKKSLLLEVGPFEDICANNAVLGDSRTEINMDKLFGNDPAREALRAFCKFRVSPEEESTVTGLIQLDAVITATIDSFKEITLGSKSWEGRNRDSEMIGGTDERNSKEEENRDQGAERALVGGDTRKSSRIKGDRIPVNASQLLKIYLPTACVQFTGSILKILLEKIPESEIEIFNAKFGISINNRHQESIPNASRKLGFLFQYPASGRYYIALLPYMFMKYICSWYRTPFDCYIMHGYGEEDHMISYRRMTGLKFSTTVMI